MKKILIICLLSMPILGYSQDNKKLIAEMELNAKKHLAELAKSDAEIKRKVEAEETKIKKAIKDLEIETKKKLKELESNGNNGNDKENIKKTTGF